MTTNGQRWTHDAIKWVIVVVLSGTLGFWGSELKGDAELDAVRTQLAKVDERVGSLETVVDGLARINCNELVDPSSRWRYNICDKIPARVPPPVERSRR